MTIKLIAVDIDGTLLNENDELTPGTIHAIQAARDRGIKVVLCTGRPLTGVTPYLEALGLSGDDQYVITYNGSLAETVSGKVLTKHSLTYNDYVDLEALARKFQVHFQVLTPDHIYTADQDISPHTVTESHFVHLPLRYRAASDMPRDLLMPTAIFIDNAPVLDKVEDQLPHEIYDRFYVVRTMPYFIEVLSKNVSKGNTLAELATTLGITAAEVMAIGDQNNDLPMLAYAGLGVAMGNANEAVKAVADRVTTPNTADGVATAIQRYALP